MTAAGKPAILIADDHSLIRKGMKMLLQLHFGFTDVVEVGSCNALMNELVRRPYTHLILDLVLPDGTSMEVLPNIQSVYPRLQILIFSMQPAEVYGEALKKYNIVHYLHKSAAEEQAVASLQAFFQQTSTREEAPPASHASTPFSSLTPRELEVLHYQLKGWKTKAISEALNLKMNTVSTLKKRIYEKTRTENLRQLLDLASLYKVNF